jgi:hypothetical protein
MYGLIEDLCYAEIQGKRVKVTDVSKYAREFMLRGMEVFFAEKAELEKLRAVQAEAKVSG